MISRAGRALRDYLSSTWTRVGIALVVVGTGPLLLFILAAAIGLWDDPNPNAVILGILARLTFWPGVICILIGVARVRSRRRNPRQT